MNEPRDQQLNSLLKRWAESRAASETRLQQLHDRIVQAAEQRTADAETMKSNLKTDLVVSRSPRSEMQVRALWFLGGIAVTILVVFGFVGRLRTPPSNVPLSNSDESLLVATELGVARLNHQTKLLEEMQRIFNGQFEWLAEKPGKVQIGLADADAVKDLDDQSSPFAIRVVVAKRTRGESRWTIEWSTDIVAKNERLVDVAIGPDGGGRLQLWAFRLPEGMIAVESEFAPSERMPVEASFGVVQKERTPQQVFETHIGDVEYKIIQTVATLNKSAT